MRNILKSAHKRYEVWREHKKQEDTASLFVHKLGDLPELKRRKRK